MKRKLSNFASALSLLLWLAAVSIWANSYSRDQGLQWVRAASWSWPGKDVSVPAFGNSEWSLVVRGGILAMSHHYPAMGVPAPGFRHVGRDEWYWDAKWFSFTFDRWAGGGVVFEMVFPFALVIVFSGMLPLLYPVRRWRRRRKDRISGGPTCSRCGYNLTANISGTCPECGTAVTGKVQIAERH